MEEEVSYCRLLPETKRPVIIKNGNVWTFKTANVILVSAGQTDKDYMIREQKNWDERNKNV